CAARFFYLVGRCGGRRGGGGVGEFRRWAVSAAALAGAVGAGYLVARYLGGVLLPFALALALSLAIDPLVGWLERRARLPRGLAALAGLSLAVAGVAALGAGLAARLAWELGDLYRALPGMCSRAAAALGVLWERLAGALQSLPEPLRGALIPAGVDLYGPARLAVGAVMEGLVGLFRRLPGSLAVLTVTFVAAYFLSRDRRVLAGAVLALAPRAWRSRVSEAGVRFLQAVRGMVGAQLLLLGATLVLTALGLWILGSRYALTLGVVAAGLDIVPYLGPATVLGPWAVFCLASGEPVMGLKLVALILALALGRQALEVRLVGARIGLHPLAVLAAMCLGVRLIGPLGVVAGPLAAALGRAVLQSGLLVPAAVGPAAEKGGRQ
ncbi:MAG: sporulation integral membrane protein YtvI, partial [Acetobacteraceae bacterium]|nr:sporulation integral membrane protein YtvI [Acetobacteraceae bacterium]